MMPVLLALAITAPRTEVGLFSGPGRACLKHSYIDLAEGESLKIEGAGTESAHFTLRASRKSLRLIESEIIGGPKVHRSISFDGGRTGVLRTGAGKNQRYSFYARGSDDPTLVLWVPTGGGAVAAALARRIHVADPEPASCSHSYRYGWDVISETLDQ
ncbi:hypothetical protein MZO42_08425 [Sphingomonas psychrotolerans]|uniref:Uncharacterized protein n=1 Tax=Sphingomonas psychrotolerans TaxID=1327635 RepID=A0ABU3N369_9SPHN|nr:hypothetical protein [Sphingomonas psychrotolerans]MDT8758721.1 hypothetical protein [Sphingomonas psychrotolerans]